MDGTEFVFPPERRDKAYKLGEIDVVSASEVIPTSKGLIRRFAHAPCSLGANNFCLIPARLNETSFHVARWLWCEAAPRLSPPLSELHSLSLSAMLSCS